MKTPKEIFGGEAKEGWGALFLLEVERIEIEEPTPARVKNKKREVVKKFLSKMAPPSSTAPFWFCAHRFPTLFFICFAFYSLLFPYLFMTSNSIATQYQLGTNVFWWLVAGERIVYGLSVVAAAYFGGKSQRKAKCVGIGFLLIAMGCFILSLTAFIAPLPAIEKDESPLWKGIYLPATKEDIATPHNMMNSYWGKRFPDDVRMHLNETGFKFLEMLEPRNVTKRALEDNEIDQMFADSIVTLRRELSFGMEDKNESGEKEMKRSQARRLTKRQMPDFEFPDATRDRLKAGFEAAVIGLVWFGDPYEHFAEQVYNLTNDQEVFERLLKAARLPFGMCRNTSMLVRERLRTQTCQSTIPNLTLVALVVASVAVALMGAGGAVVGMVGLPYIEDLVGWRNFPKYLVALAFIHYICSAAGLGLGKVCDLLVYSTMKAPASVTAIDPRWVGAWWLGLLLIFLLLKIPSLIMVRVGLAKQNNATNAVCANGDSGQAAGGDTDTEADNGDQPDRSSYTVNPAPGAKNWKIRGLFDAILELFRPPVYVSLIFALTFHAMAFYGYFMFLPVYLNNNFILDAFFNGTYLTAVAGLYICIGLSIGAVFVYRFKFDGRKLALLLVICTFIIFMLSLLQKWVGCHGTVSRLQELSLQNPTNRPSWPACPGCICDAADFYPVCANDTHRTPFYSPCHAGCTNFTYKIAKMDVDFTFDYCACAETPRTLVSRNFCRGDCSLIHGLFYILFGFVSLTAGVLIVPSIMIAMRSAAHENRSLSLGTLAFCVYIFGVLPSSVLYRFVTDSSCFVWKSTCGIERGHCEMYDTHTLRDRFHGFAALLNLIAYLFFSLVWYHSKDLKLAKEPEQPAVVEVVVVETQKEELDEVNLKEEKGQNGETIQNGGGSADGQGESTFIGKL